MKQLSTEELEFHRRCDAILEAALELEGEDREAYLTSACGDDDRLRRRVDELLAAVATTTGVLRPGGALALELVEALEGRSRTSAHVGRYRLVEELGRGGMGVVYRAQRRDGAYEQTVAVKLLKPGAGSAAIERFTRERQILATLDHPNVARLLDGGVTEEREPFLVVEYVEGLPIDRYCEVNDLVLEDRLRLLVALCAGVHEAHRRLVVHRDIKPANILITESGQPKLLDFGIAKLLEGAGWGGSELTAAGHRMMTLQYASPEQFRGEPVTVASDVYQLGLVAYEIVTGVRPYSLTETLPSTAQRLIAEEEPPPPSATAVDAARQRRLSGDVDTIIMKAIRKEPDRRYRSVEELRLDIERYLAGLPIQARKSTVIYRASKFARRHAVAVALLTFLTMLLVVASATLTARLIREQRRTRAAAELARERQLVAENALAESEEQLQFLRELFVGATPDAAQGQSLSVLALLDRGRGAVEARFDGHARAQARLLTTLAELYRMQGQLDSADETLRGARRLAEQELGGGAPAEEIEPVLGEILHELGKIETRRGRYADAVRHYREALEITDRWTGPRSQAAGWMRIGLAVAQLESQAFDEAAANAELAASILEERLGGDHPETLSAKRVLGDALTRQGRYAEAHDLMIGVVERLRRIAPGTTTLIGALNALALSEGDFGKFEEEVDLLEESLRLAESLVGPEHVGLVITLHNLGLALSESGRHAEGEARQREALARAAAAGHEQFEPDVRGALALDLMVQGRSDEALLEAERAVELGKRVLAPGHYRFAMLEHNRALTLANVGRSEEAEAGFRRALEGAAASLPPGHAFLAEPLLQLAMLERDRNALDDAAALARRAFAIADGALGVDHPIRLEALELWMEALELLGLDEERSRLEHFRDLPYEEGKGEEGVP